MRFLQGVFAAICLMIGLPVLLLGTAELVDPNINEDVDKDGALAAMAILGLPATGLGTWMIFNLRHHGKQKTAQLNLEQEQLFLQLLQQNGGEITIATFALEAQIPIKEAKEYLDQKAKQLDAGFDVSSEGGIIYKFPIALP